MCARGVGGKKEGSRDSAAREREGEGGDSISTRRKTVRFAMFKKMTLTCSKQKNLKNKACLSCPYIH